MTNFAHADGNESNRRPNKCSVDLFWSELIERLFPTNTAACLASFTRTSVRAAEHVLQGRNRLSGGALINLLRSPVGARVLDAIAGQADWRAVERRLLEIYELEQELQNLEQKKRHLDAQLRLSAR